MTRHGKNCTAGAVYSYHERKKDTAASGYGTQRVRVGRDAIKDFDCCCLSLQPCRDPVVTPEGFLYEREAIVTFLLQQKNKIARETKAWQRQREQRRREREQQRGEGAAKALRGFLEAETPLGKGETPGNGSGGPSPSGPLPSFWIPSLTPEAAAERLQRPERSVRCPMSGRKLRLSQLVSVHFTPAQPGLSPGQLLAREPSDRYVCALTGDPLGNATPCAVLRPSGAVVTLASVDRLIRKDMRDPLSGAALTDDDIIVLQRGGTGFAGAGVSLEAKKSRPVMQA
ncbi:nitric oxide synthase-interacting protein isoform X2 [Poecile atricapillus]|uniref:nitric oxide synthase-interacting protein isoform X2 n=1 Tax=Poecile atricapillus TaxID=48891 RepID=UPI002738A8E8|nr:nitric oxide synthase-interacting protein isoform X2 [Poecile atricapillus]